MKWIKVHNGWRSGDHFIRSLWGRRDGRSGPANQRIGWITETGERFKKLNEAKAAIESKRYRWSSVEFSEEYPIVWVRPVLSPPGEATGIPVTFRSLGDLKELAATLRGAVNAIERERSGGRRA